MFFFASVSIYKVIHTLFFPTNTQNRTAGSSDSNVVFTELTEPLSVANEHNRSPKIAIQSQRQLTGVCCVAIEESIIPSSCQSVKFSKPHFACETQRRRVNWLLLRGRCVQMNKQLLMPFFFFSFLQSEMFLLNSANLPHSNETLCEKKTKKKQDWIFLKAAC